MRFPNDHQLVSSQFALLSSDPRVSLRPTHVKTLPTPARSDSEDSFAGQGLPRILAFSLVELLTVVAVVLILAGLVLGAIQGGMHRSRATSCLGNFRQLMQGLSLYATDHNDWLPPNPDTEGLAPYSRWCSGNAGRGGGHEFDTQILSDPSYNMLLGYVGNEIKLFRCPADRRRKTLGSRTVLAARTVSMNQAVGTNPDASFKSPVVGPWLGGVWSTTNAGFAVYGRLSDFVEPGPDSTWVLIDESDFNLNDAAFAVSMVGGFWLDFPGRYHANASSISFADGHAETHKWRNLHKPSGIQPEISNPDWQWLRDRTSYRLLSGH